MKRVFKFLMLLIIIQLFDPINIVAEYTDSCTSRSICPIPGLLINDDVSPDACYYHFGLGKCIEYRFQSDCNTFDGYDLGDSNFNFDEITRNNIENPLIETAQKYQEDLCNKTITANNFCTWNSSSQKCEKGKALPTELSITLPVEMPQSSKKEEENINEEIVASSCADFNNEKDCLVGESSSGARWGCAWNKDYKFCSPTGLAYLSCGSGDSIAYDIPVIVPRLVSYAITILKTITPVILIIIGMFQLIKAITSQNDDEMKKAKSSLVKKLIAAVIIFFMVSIVQFVVSKVADDSEQSSLSACMACFINNDCGKSMYYTDRYGNCYSVATDGLVECPVEEY